MASHNDTEIRERLSDETLRSRLREAVTKDKKELLEGLLHDSPDSLDSTYENGAGLLHLAAGYGIQRCLLVLLAADRSKVSDQDKSGCRPLHYAAGNGHLDTLRCLLEYGADLCDKNKEGESPLTFACLAGKFEAASLLLEKHCEAQNLEEAFRDNCKNTLLHFAMIGDHQMVKQLLEKLSQLDNDKVVLNQIANSMNKGGHTILQVATQQSHYHEVKSDLKQLQVIMDENIGVTEMVETSDSSAVASAAGVTLKFPSAATQQVKKQNGSARYREMSPEPLMLLAATPNHLSMSGNPDFVRMDSKVTPITDGIIPIENPTSGLLIKKAILHKYHSVTVQPFKIDEFNPNERQSYLGVHRPTDTGRMLELLCGLHGLVVERLAANHFLVSALVMIKCDRDNPLKVKVTIPHARALKTATDKQASNEIQVFTVSTAGEIPVPLPQQEYSTDLHNCVITTVINKQQIFAVTVLGEFLTLNKKSLSHTKPPAIRCIYHVILSEPVDSSGCITADVFCAIDLPTTRKILTEERKSRPDAEGTFILSHDHIEMSYRITKGHGWLIPEKEHRVSALQILPSSQSENYEYPPSWKFKIFPDKSLKKVSSQVECHLNITAGTVKLVQERFNHTHPNQYHQLSASSSIDDPSSLHSAMTDSLTQGTTNGDIKGARHGDGDMHTNAHNDSSTEDGQTITVQLTKSGESRGNSQGTVV